MKKPDTFGFLMIKYGAMLLFAAAVVAVMVATAAFTGFTIATLWGWFLVPLGVVKIGYATSYGIALLISATMNTRGLAMPGKGKGGDLAQLALAGILVNVVALCLGWITITYFM